MKLAKCKFCGAVPVMGRPDHRFQARCRCGATSWVRDTPEAAARIWGGDAQGDGYQQMKDTP